MKISTIETDSLPNDYAMVWFGFTLPDTYLISWLCVHKSKIELQPNQLTFETFDKINFGDHLDRNELEKIRCEAFPAQGVLLELGLTNRVVAAIPLSEKKRCGL